MLGKFFNILTKNYLLVFILILAAVLRLYHLDFQSPWLDEIHSLNESNPNISLTNLYGQIISGEQMPPLYFYLLYIFFKIFGYSIFAARTFSALIGIGAVYSIYLLAKKMTFSKEIGLVSALLLGLNYFMIYYSQEARPYMLFALFVILSYYRMISFIQSPTRKNIIYYGLVACIMLHSHFIGFFTLFAQGLTLIVYLIYLKDKNRITFFKYLVVAALIILIGYIPALDALMSILEIKEFWIPIPKKDAFQSIYETFFGDSEIIIFLNLIFFTGFIFALTKPIEEVKEEKSLVQWSIIALVLWVSISVLVPFIRSYTANPIILDRYFIALLPAILIIFAIGLKNFNNKVIRICLVSTYLIFCFVHITVVKKYYSSVNKSQFREATNYIIENNNSNDKLVSSLAWYLPYFFNSSNNKQEIVKYTLDDFVKNLNKNELPLSSFWYFDGHSRLYNPNKETEEFLSDNFIIEHNYSGFQSWTRHYVVKNEKNSVINFTKEELDKLLSNNRIKNNIEKFNFENNILNVKGWALFEGVNSKNTKIQLMLLNNQTGYLVHTLQDIRTDVTSYFRLNYNADYSGFNTSNGLKSIPSGNYILGVWLKNEKENKEGLFFYNDTKIKI